MSSNQKLLLGLLLLVAVVGVFVYFKKFNSPVTKVNSFEECVQAGYPLSEEYIYPPQCKTPEGKVFSQPTPTNQPGIPNPASIYCQDQGGKLEIRKDIVGNETGFCVFTDGSECEEWAYFRHECSPSVSLKENFCGSSTYGNCDSDDDCKTGGCSGQVCQSKKEEGAITTCEWTDCYDSAKYGLKCRCTNRQCQWQE